MVRPHVRRLCDDFVREADLSDIDTARAAWNRMVAARKWSPAYAARIRSAFVTEIAADRPVVGRALSTVYTERSHETAFRIHDCLPRAVRAGPVADLRYRLLAWIAERLVDHLRSASRRGLQKMLLTVDRLLFRTEPTAPAATSLAEAVERVRGWTAAEWVRRFGSMYPDDTSPRMGVKLFRAHIRLLNVLHGRVFAADGSKGEATIPMAPAGSVLDADGALSGYSSFAFSDGEGGGGGSADARWQLQQTIRVLRLRLCKRRRPNAPPAAAASAFTPEEMVRILDAARTTEERVMVLLFATTGVRIGGLCRLETASRAPWARDIRSDHLHTVEKGNEPRTLHLNEGTRLCLARWFRECAPSDRSTRFVFPGGAAEGCVSSAYVWRRIREVFRRAGLAAHPHTFRHTFVHMMLALGVSSETIAKFIGHRSAQTTGGVYGRLSGEEMAALAAATPLIGDGRREEALRDGWRTVLRRFQRPYEFSANELHGL